MNSSAIIRPLGGDVLCRSTAAEADELRLAGEPLQQLLVDCCARYEDAVRSGMDGELLAIGRELFAALDGNGWASAWAARPGVRAFEVRVDDYHAALGRALLDAPWELLAGPHGHLADDGLQLFAVVRRIGAAGEALAVQWRDLHVLFMAAAPAGADVLDFEGEEAAILAATDGLPLQLVVEESGSAQQLGERLRLDGPFSALHLSCHGTIDDARGPLLALEDEAGERATVDAGELAAELGDPCQTPLVFLSACRSAEDSDSGDGRRVEPFVRDLTRAGFAHVLGWDGSVYDRDAMHFAQTFYRRLAAHDTVPHATARARLALRQAQLADNERGRHWHLARLYLGPAGGGALSAAGRAKRTPPGAASEAQFLDSERQAVPVARRSEFVGRRRALQQIFKAQRSGAAGVLLHGMANLGKSSLAARVASRLNRHRTVVVFARYDALTVFDRLADALPAAARRAFQQTWRPSVIDDQRSLREALETLLEDGAADPLLLIIDDLERVLDLRPQTNAAAPLQPGDARSALSAILAAFAHARAAGSESFLLLTSRYRFTLPDANGRDLAAALVGVPLQPLDAGDQRKQLQAAARAFPPPANAGPLLERALAAAAGNPGLQAVLTQPILAGETASAADALAAIEHYQRAGVPPAAIRRLLERGDAGDEANAVVAFFRRMAFERYAAALTTEQADTLRAACLFAAAQPVARAALVAAADALRVGAPAAAIDRLLGLGLLDDWGRPAGLAHAAVNPLARPLAKPLTAAETSCLAAAALPALANAWRRPDGEFDWDARAVEVARLALAATAPDPALLAAAAAAAARYFYEREHDARRAHEGIVQPALARLAALGAAPANSLLLIAADCAERLGETAAEERIVALLERIAGETADPGERGGALLYVARQQQRQGRIAAAEESFATAATAFALAGSERERTIARGGSADILQARGELDEALRIRVEEQLPVYERLGDVREKAVTQGKIADILQARGELDEALRIRVEEEIPVYERLGDVREKAVTQGKIADILQARGQFAEALALHEKRLPVAERMRDLDSIAHIRYSTAALRLQLGQHTSRGLQRIYDDLAEAFALSRQLGRPDFIGGVGQLLAQVLALAGERESALEVLTLAEQAFAKIKDADGLALVRELRAEIGGS